MFRMIYPISYDLSYLVFQIHLSHKGYKSPGKGATAKSGSSLPDGLAAGAKPRDDVS